MKFGALVCGVVTAGLAAIAACGDCTQHRATENQKNPGDAIVEFSEPCALICRMLTQD